MKVLKFVSGLSVLIFFFLITKADAQCTCQSARLCVAIDDTAWVWINGEYVGEFLYVNWDEDGKEPKCVNISCSMLSEDNNIIAIKVSNGNGYEIWGSWALDITCTNGQHAYTVSGTGVSMYHYNGPDYNFEPADDGNGNKWYDNEYSPSGWGSGTVVTGETWGKRITDPSTGNTLRVIGYSAESSTDFEDGQMLFWIQPISETPVDPPPPPNITVTKTASKTKDITGPAELYFTITVKNEGGGTGQEVKIVDTWDSDEWQMQGPWGGEWHDDLQTYIEYNSEDQKKDAWITLQDGLPMGASYTHEFKVQTWNPVTPCLKWHNNVKVTFEGGSNSYTLDLANACTPPSSIGDYVWLDEDMDGIQDAGESGISGVTVKLYKQSGSQVATTTTDANGKYLFEDIETGSYYLEFVLPTSDDYRFTDQNATGDTKDSDANPSTGRTDYTTLDEENDMTWDCGMYIMQPASIGDKVWNDEDMDGVQDAGESGLSGVTVTLYTRSGSQVATTTTNSSGEYSFTDLDPDDYYLEFDLLTDYTFSPKDATSESSDSDANTSTGRTDYTTLDSGEDDMTWDVGMFIPPPASIGDKVWEDTDMDGIQDAGESGISGVTVTLFLEGGTQVATTTTDASGEYSFTDLEADNYYLEFELPTDYLFSPQDATSEGSDSDPHTSTGRTSVTPLEPGEEDMTWDAGMYLPLPASIGDKVWEDTDMDGIQDAGESGLSGVTVTLFLESGSQVATTTTDASGNYSFTDLEADNYYLEFELPTDYLFSPQDETSDDSDSDPNTSTGRTIVTNLESGEDDMTWDAGMYLPLPASIGDKVWEDTNQDGIQDAGESGLSGVTVILYAESGSQVATTTTDASGNYSFTDIEAGNYYLEFELPTNYLFSPQDETSDDSDSDPHTSTGRTSVTPLESGEEDMTWDCGMYLPLPASIGDYVWEDTDMDGVQDAGESGLSGVNVTLFLESGTQVATTTTDGSGAYSFTDIDADNYYLEFELPTNYIFSPQDATSDDSDSDPNTSTGRTIVTNLEAGEDDVTWDAGMIPLEQATIDADPRDMEFFTPTLDIILLTNADRIYFTMATDGEIPADPDTNDASQLYTGTITIDDTTTIKAIAVGDGFIPSEIGQWTYIENFEIIITPQATVSADPGTSSYATATLDVTLTSNDPENRIYYTTNGSEPDTNNSSQVYSGPITISGDVVITAIAIGDTFLPSDIESWTYTQDLPYATINANPGSSVYETETLDVTLTSEDGNRIYYTTDGSDPDTNDASQLYSGPITITGDVVLRAIAFGTGYLPTEGSWTYDCELPSATLEADPEGTTYTTVSLDVLLSTKADRIYYTTDGSAPDTNNSAQLYSNPVNIYGDTVTLRAIAVGEGYVPAQDSWVYIRDWSQASINANPGTSTYSTVSIDVTLTTNADRIYYTTDGSDPDTNNSAQLYDSPVTISGDVTLKAIAVGEGLEASDIGSWTYTQDLPYATINADPGSSVYATVSLDVTLSSEEGNSIYYTTDGSDPDTNNSDQLYTGPITISGDVTLRAVAFGPGYLPNEGSWTYDCELPSATIEADPEGTSYSTVSLDVILSTNADRIYYTTDGSAPDTNNSEHLYSDPVNIYGDTVTLRAIAVGVGYVPGQGSWVYIRDWPAASLSADPGSTVYETVELKVTLTSESGNSIYYTLDGTDPDTTDDSQLYTGPVTISGDVELRAIAFGPGYMPTEGSWTYDCELPSATLNADPEGTTYNTVSLDVILTTNAERIYYTTDGSDPDTNDASQLYSEKATVSGDTVTLKAIAVGLGYIATSDSWTYIRTLPNATLTANPGDGTYFGSTLEVELSSNAEKIYYTIDGSAPDTNNSDQLYTGAITIPEDSPDTVVINAIAVGSEYSPTSKSWTYYRDYLPEITAMPGSVEFVESIEVQLLINRSDAKIYYTLDGTEPDINSPSTYEYTGSTITITETGELKAIAFASDAVASPTLSEIYTRVYAVKEAKYKDIDGDGRIDIAELKFDELPDSLPVEVVLINPFNNSEKDTVGSSGISWLNDDSSTLTVVITLNESFPYSEKTGFETGYYGAVIEGLYKNDAFEISDGIAPVINTATYCPGEIINLQTLERAFDTLVVYFTEEVKDIDFYKPFVFKTEDGIEYDFELEVMNHSGSMCIFKVIKEVEVAYPFKDDSIKIYYKAGISDLGGNVQDVEDNRYAKLIVKPKPYKVIVSSLSPVDPVYNDIPKELIAKGIEISKGIPIVVDFLMPLEDDADKLKCNVSIFDPVGNLVIECRKINTKSGNLQMGIVEGTSTKLVIYWTGQNENGRQVGKGMYIAEINVLDHNKNWITLKHLVGVKK